MRLKFRSSDFYSRVGVLELRVQPAEKGTKRHPHIANGLGRQWLFTTIEAHRLALGAQPGYVTSKVGRLNFRNLSITNVIQPMTERELIGGNCALALAKESETFDFDVPGELRFTRMRTCV